MADEPDFYGLGVIPAIPTYIPPFDADDRYSLQLISPRSRARIHSIHAIQPLLAKVDPQDVWMHSEDAALRGIANGQRERVFNKRGATELPVRVTDRIARGAVSMKEGAWYTLNDSGTDNAGSTNVLTLDKPPPANSQTYNTCLIQVKPVRKSA